MTKLTTQGIDWENSKHATRTREEILTRELFDRAPEDDSFQTLFVRRVFEAQYHAAITAQEVTEIGSALTRLKADPAVIQNRLTQLVIAGVLRSRLSAGGKRLYEVNY